ncbi:MAG TPA: exopolysaccharide biosynthesis polyprenyl glycosylphosphotransferase [Terriglobales bacterium]|nr:exopolysaccharide biosynthesis polyprenyl glycosylphosphotransferase [Terriglobales bacterium]
MILRLRYYRFCLRLVAYLLPYLAFELGWRVWAFFWRSAGLPVDFSASGHFGLAVFATAVWVAMAEHYQVTSVDELFRERTGTRRAFSACIATFALLLAALFFQHTLIFPRGLFVIGMALLLLLAVLMRMAFRIYVRKKVEEGRPLRLLVVGADRYAQKAASRLEAMTICSCRVVGFIGVEGGEVTLDGQPLYNLEAVPRLSDEGAFDEVVIALHPAQFHQIPKILSALDRLSLPLRAIVDLGEGVVVRERLFQLGRMQMLDLTTTPAESLDYSLLKRAFDVVFSALVLALAAPLLLVIALATRLTSPGPVMFVQERVGLNGRIFRMYKFRTMRPGPASESDTAWTREHDPRCTPLGALLRKLSLDELPQFYNVLRGDMSVVGPRPERPHFVQVFLNEIARYNNRHWLKVGITGWAQVHGWRGNTSIEKRLEYDMYYVQNWSLSLDLKIIALTVLGGILSRNAY